MACNMISTCQQYVHKSALCSSSLRARHFCNEKFSSPSFDSKLFRPLRFAHSLQQNIRCNDFSFRPKVLEPKFIVQAYAQGFDIPDPEEEAKRALAYKQIETSSQSFIRLGLIGFWAQFICSIVSAVILAFSVFISGKPTSPVTTYLTAGGIVAALLSVFWFFGYIRLGERLKAVLNTDLDKAPSRASVVQNIISGLVINLIGLGATLLGLQATVGLLVAKALTSTVTPLSQGAIGYNPVLALDVFLVQASGNTLLSHFIGLILTLELLRIITRPQGPAPILPKPFR